MKFGILTALVIFFLSPMICQSQSVVWGGGVDDNVELEVIRTGFLGSDSKESITPSIPATASIALFSIATTAGLVRRKGLMGAAESMESPLRVDREAYTQDLA